MRDCVGRAEALCLACLSSGVVSASLQARRRRRLAPPAAWCAFAPGAFVCVSFRPELRETLSTARKVGTMARDLCADASPNRAHRAAPRTSAASTGPARSATVRTCRIGAIADLPALKGEVSNITAVLVRANAMSASRRCRFALSRAGIDDSNEINEDGRPFGPATALQEYLNAKQGAKLHDAFDKWLHACARGALDRADRHRQPTLDWLLPPGA